MRKTAGVLVWGIIGAAGLVVWLVLAFAHGSFWRTSVRLPPAAEPARWPTVVAVVPARDEAAVLPHTLPTLVGQHYPGAFRVVVVDDDSTDGTGALARSLVADVVVGQGPPPGWTGKVAAMARGFDAAPDADLVLFTDADIAYAEGTLTELVRSSDGYDLVSQMVRLRCDSFWERVIVPAFVYFFAQLYPFSQVNRSGRVAAAAGGCMLVRRDALVAAGGLERIRDAVIDDVSLGRLLKARGPVWLGLSDRIVSARAYPQLTDLWTMVSRSAYTQLRHSPVLLAGTVMGLALTYLAAPAAFVAGLCGAGVVPTVVGALGWALMAATYLPMLRFYRRSPLWALGLPLVATMYAAMTVDSARRHLQGRGAMWKGRAAASAGR